VDPELASADTPLGRMAERVVLELTERSTLDEVNNVVSRVGVLRYLGFRIAIDDLGSGYAGLTSFARFEPDFVKLDPSLINDVAQSGACWKVVQTITALCSDMQMSVVAEGVERSEVRDCLLELGLSLMQGYLFGRPSAPLT
jgi:EAL domain-containing protein (putative c-di-GMP-specific phosphodiesterase class I)